MCGFLAIATRQPLEQRLDVTRLNADVLRHRGPDSTGDFAFPHVYVRHWRLSIVDLGSTSNQPYGTGDARLIYNGEIYDYQEAAARLGLTVTGDTPLVYELCQRGIDKRELANVRGFYAYLHLRNRGMQISGGRDPFGKKPLFYYVDDDEGIAVFASEERAIVDVLRARQIDFDGVGEYLVYKQTFSGRTFFKGITQLAPGAHFEFDAARWSMTIDRTWAEYYDMPAARVFALSESDTGAADNESLVYAALQESVVLRIPRDVSACIALSGGVDSGLVAHVAAHTPLLDHVSQFLTIGFEEDAADESVRAAQMARMLAIDRLHTLRRFTQRDLFASLRRCIEHAHAPLEHPHYLSYFVLSEAAAQFAKVLITGEGADELFMGYEHYLAPGASFAFREYLRPDDEACFLRAAGAAAAFDEVRHLAAVGPLRERALSSRAASREAELKTHLLTLLSRNDKMGMAHSVEIRAPFLDRRMMATALALPERALVSGGEVKRVLKHMFVDKFDGMALQPKKIGFRVPFDEAFEAGRHTDVVRGSCELAAAALASECGLQLQQEAHVSPRLGWSLMNIGMFLDSQGWAA